MRVDDLTTEVTYIIIPQIAVNRFYAGVSQCGCKGEVELQAIIDMLYGFQEMAVGNASADDPDDGDDHTYPEEDADLTDGFYFSIKKHYY